MVAPGDGLDATLTAEDALASAPTLAGETPAPLGARPGGAPGSTQPVGLALPEVSLDDAAFAARYALRARIGAGGMGEVRACMDNRIGREVALKVMHAHAEENADSRARFVREARVQGQLEHPSVVPVYDLGRDPEGRMFFTMKRVRGITLEDVLRRLRAGDAEARASFTRRRLLTAFSQVCLAVHFAHTRGVLHRDLKPGNIMLGEFGEVNVLDWGLAKVRSAPDAPGEPRPSAPPAVEPGGDGGETLHGSLLGTPGYMAPEQARGESDGIDARADVYALGAILFELLTLQPLHGQGTVGARLDATLRGADARAHARAPEREVPPELEAVCVRATRTEAAERFASAREVAAAVERFLDGDRDVERRREMAAGHAEAAREALARAARAPAGEGAEIRADAMRELGRALALDPTHATALATIAQLLVEVPDAAPPQAEAELAAQAARTHRAAARASAVRFLTWLAMVPVAFWMGIRDARLAWVVGGALVLAEGVAWWMWLTRRVTLAHRLALLALSSFAISTLSLMFGVLILATGLASTNTMFFAMHTERRLRPAVVAVGALSLVVPVLLELAGWLPRAYDVRDGALRVLPRAAHFAPVPTALFLAVSTLALVVTPAFLVGRLRDALAAAERRQVLQAWHLRQLLPMEARAAMGAPPPPSR